MPSKALVVDANILIRAVLGKRVRGMIETYCDEVSFFIAETAYAEAEEHLSRLVIKRGEDPEKPLTVLRALRNLVELIGSDVYAEFEADSRERLASAILRTGPFWLAHWRFAVQSGRKTPTSSGVEWPHGPPTAFRSFYESEAYEREARGGIAAAFVGTSYSSSSYS
jgi:hypothetical protein